MAHVETYLSIEDLAARYRACEDVCAARHYQTIWLLAQGHTVSAVSAMTSFVPRWIEELLARYNALGEAALGDLRRHNGTRPSVLKRDLLDKAQDTAAGAAAGRRGVVEPKGGGLHGGRTRAGEARAAARLGGAQGDRLVDPVAPAEEPESSDAGSRKRLLKKLAETLAEEAAKHPDKPVEVWATDEHRLGLKPIHRRVWAPIGERPIALGHHRYEWLYVTAFVAPASGETVWFLSNGIDKPFFAKLLEAFARDTGAGRDRIIVLQLDNAGWHTPENLPVPDGIRLVYQPAYTPELQPAEHLWPLVDEPLANKHFETIDDLDAVVALRCRDLNFDRSLIAQHTGFHWWPKSAAPN